MESDEEDATDDAVANRNRSAVAAAAAVNIDGVIAAHPKPGC